MPLLLSCHPLLSAPLLPLLPPISLSAAQDATFNEIIAFLDAVDMHGKNIPTKVQDHPDKPVDAARCNVSAESRVLKKMFIRLR